MRLAGKSAMITGAGRGIGRAIAETFSREGCRVLVTDVDFDSANAVAEAIRAQGGQAVSLPLDVTNRPDVAAAVNEAVRIFERLDIMVNNASLQGGPWTQTISVNRNVHRRGRRLDARRWHTLCDRRESAFWAILTRPDREMTRSRDLGQTSTPSLAPVPSLEKCCPVEGVA